MSEAFEYDEEADLAGAYRAEVEEEVEDEEEEREQEEEEEVEETEQPQGERARLLAEAAEALDRGDVQSAIALKARALNPPQPAAPTPAPAPVVTGSELDAAIAAAEQDGDLTQSFNLKAQKLAEIRAGLTEEGYTNEAAS